MLFIQKYPRGFEMASGKQKLASEMLNEINVG